MKKEETYLGEIHEKYEISLNSEMKASYRRDFAQYVIDKERQNGRVIETDGRASYPNENWISAFPHMDDYAACWILDMLDWSTDSEHTLDELFSSLFNRWEVGNSIEFNFTISD